MREWGCEDSMWVERGLGQQGSGDMEKERMAQTSEIAGVGLLLAQCPKRKTPLSLAEASVGAEVGKSELCS